MGTQLLTLSGTTWPKAAFPRNFFRGLRKQRQIVGASGGSNPMIEKVIEYSIHNRFLVLLLAVALALGGVYAVLNTPVDAIPDLSENQVIVFTDWMGRSPREIEDQVTYPLSLK